jgi:hypothetical protein
MQQIDDFYAVEFVGEPYYQFSFQVEDLLKILRVWSGYLDPILECVEDVQLKSSKAPYPLLFRVWNGGESDLWLGPEKVCLSDVSSTLDVLKAIKRDVLVTKRTYGNELPGVLNKLTHFFEEAQSHSLDVWLEEN